MGASKKSDKPTVVDGIELNVTAEDFDDFEITECMATLGDPDAEDGERLTATVRMFRLVFKVMWQHLFGRSGQRLRPASLNPTGVM